MSPSTKIEGIFKHYIENVILKNLYKTRFRLQINKIMIKIDSKFYSNRFLTIINENKKYAFSGYMCDPLKLF
jgi:hypothetical protein